MSRNKKLFITTILLLIAAACVCFIVLDFSRFFGTRNYGSVFPSRTIKLIVVFITTFLVFISGKDVLSAKDAVMMKVLFAFILSADIAFVLGSMYFGIGLFAVCQVLLIIRNSRGLKKNLLNENRAKKISISISALIILIGTISLITFLFYPILKLSILLVIISVYGLILSCSLWIGSANYILELFPKKNSIMVAIGMICFYCGDFLVGLEIVMETGFNKLVVSSITWIFFTPAIVLLALSGYRYEGEYGQIIDSDSLNV